MTRTAAAARQEPDAPFNPQDRLLDIFEQTVVALRDDHGLEEQMRARLDRLLPPRRNALPASERKLKLTNAYALLCGMARRRHTEAEHLQIAAAREFLKAELEAA